MISIVKKLDFIKELDNQGEAYFVGGCVRDMLLNKESKDIDLLVLNIEINKLISILEKFGDVNLVGKSFGVLKYRDNSFNEDIDIALPRKEVKVGQGHCGFKIETNHDFTLEDDLVRRDFKINALVMNLKGEIIDLFGGLTDIENKSINMVNPSAFAEDPLRMLRAVGFASRFNMSIQDETFNLIRSNVDKINEIPIERIITELDKIFYKGNHLIGINFLLNTGLYSEILGYTDINDRIEYIPCIKHIDDFYFVLCGSKEVCEKVLKFNKQRLNHINVISKIHSDIFVIEDEFNYISKYNDLFLSSGILNCLVPNICSKLKSDDIIFDNKKLVVDGNDLYGFNIKPEDIGLFLNDIKLRIFKGTMKNNKQDIFKLLI